MKRRLIEAASRPAKRCCNDKKLALANTMCELLEGRPDVVKDATKAFHMAEEGFLAGCVHSRGVLGRCYMTGAGVECDQQRGLQLGKESADAGSPYGEFVVAHAYALGVGGFLKDLVEAEQHYEAAALLGVAEARYCLANIWIDGVQLQNQKESYEKAIAVLRPASAEGHPDAQILLARMLCSLGSLKRMRNPALTRTYRFQRKEEALELLQLAISQGNARNHLGALFHAAEIYQEQNLDFEAFEFYKLASDQGCLESRLRIAQAHKKGLGTPCNKAEALRLLELLAEDEGFKGHHTYEDLLSTLQDTYHRKGNVAGALKWSQAGADAGFSQCQLDLANIYEGVNPRKRVERDMPPVLLEGDGIEADFSSAFKYYQMSDTQEGNYRATTMLEQGLGVDQNVAQATRLLTNNTKKRR